MSASVNRLLPLFLLCIVFAAGSAVPADTAGIPMVEFEYIGCDPDGNNSAVDATLINNGVFLYNAVCSDDMHDWYVLPLKGDLKWGGYLECGANGPGLRVGLYVNTGAGLMLIMESSPTAIQPGDELQYYLEWDVSELAGYLGQQVSPPGIYYIRITYYTYYPDPHPYWLFINLEPAGFKEPTNISHGTAKTLNPDAAFYGHLSAAHLSNWFTFTIAPGQSGTGVIFGQSLSGHTEEKGSVSFPPSLDLAFYDSNLSLIGNTTIGGGIPGALDLLNLPPTAPGTYYIEVAYKTCTPCPDWEAYYMVYNNALAPDTGTWGPDANNDMQSAAPLTEGAPLAGAVYYPRDMQDYYSFSTQYYFLGDILLGPASDLFNLGGGLRNDKGQTADTRMIPNTGLTCRLTPANPGNHYIILVDYDKMSSPVQYTATLYEHGLPMAGPVGHSTPETAMELPPGITTQYYVIAEDACIDFQPGMQDVFYFTMNVPVGDTFAGYYELKGSRPDYQAQTGTLHAGQLQWSDPMTPDSRGRLFIDLSYGSFKQGGTHFLKVAMLPSSPGRMRVFVDNNSRNATCGPDDNNSLENAVYLKNYLKGNNFIVIGEVCPVHDVEDYYYFTSDDFDYPVGPRQFIRMKGGVAGMEVVLLRAEPPGVVGSAEVMEDGGAAIIDLDGIIVPNAKYYVVVGRADEDLVQVYDLELCPDPVLGKPYHLTFVKQKIKFPRKAFVKLDDD